MAIHWPAIIQQKVCGFDLLLLALFSKHELPRKLANEGELTTDFAVGLPGSWRRLSGGNQEVFHHRRGVFIRGASPAFHRQSLP